MANSQHDPVDRTHRFEAEWPDICVDILLSWARHVGLAACFDDRGANRLSTDASTQLLDKVNELVKPFSGADFAADSVHRLYVAKEVDAGQSGVDAGHQMRPPHDAQVNVLHGRTDNVENMKARGNCDLEYLLNRLMGEELRIVLFDRGATDGAFPSLTTHRMKVAT